jgi:hypothetical protein
MTALYYMLPGPGIPSEGLPVRNPSGANVSARRVGVFVSTREPSPITTSIVSRRTDAFGSEG